jgi:hypothetical protein
MPGILQGHPNNATQARLEEERRRLEVELQQRLEQERKELERRRQEETVVNPQRIASSQVQ